MATVTDIDITEIETGMTKRQFLKAAGYSVGAKGKFSREQNELITLAESKGYVFDVPAPAVKTEKPAVSQKEIDPLEFNEWEVSKGYTVSERRWPNARIVEFLAENPNFTPRTAPVKAAKANNDEPMPEYDPKAVRAWANENNITVPSRGRFSRDTLKAYFDAGNTSSRPAPVVREDRPVADKKPEQFYGPTPEPKHDHRWFEGIGSKGTKVRKSCRDADAIRSISLTYCDGPWFSFDPDNVSAGISDPSKLVRLTPVNA